MGKTHFILKEVSVLRWGEIAPWTETGMEGTGVSTVVKTHSKRGEKTH